MFPKRLGAPEICFLVTLPYFGIPLRPHVDNGDFGRSRSLVGVFDIAFCLFCGASLGFGISFDAGKGGT